MLDFIKWFFGITEKRPHEIEKGIPKPSYLLAGIIEAKIIQNAHNIEENSDFSISMFYSVNILKFDNVCIHFRLATESRYTQLWDSFDSITFDGIIFEFDKPEKEQILRALRKARSLNITALERKKFFEREQRAIDLIEKCFTTKKPLIIENMSPKAQQGYHKLINTATAGGRDYLYITRKI